MLLPDLHRIDKVAQWETIPPEMWNEWQSRAAATNGWDTPANRETLKGFVTSMVGLEFINYGHDLAGTALLLKGRQSDIKDGKIAAETGTMGPIGEAADAVGDNLLLLRAMIVLRKRHIISTAEVTSLAAIIGLKFLASANAKAEENGLHASRLGKYSMYAVWGGMIIRTASNGTKTHFPEASEKVTTVSKKITWAAIGAMGVAAVDYTINTLRSKP
jgi:phosphatidylglycerophosphate synthase